MLWFACSNAILSCEFLSILVHISNHSEVILNGNMYMKSIWLHWLYPGRGKRAWLVQIEAEIVISWFLRKEEPGLFEIHNNPIVHVGKGTAWI